LFAKTDWEAEDRQNLRTWTSQQLKEFGDRFSWNKEGDVAPILPMVHGTDKDVAFKICDSGFSNLSLLDAGYYGRGMYFTRSAYYALPYYGTKKEPAVLICLTIPGNSYPVVEHRNEKQSFLGRPIKSGYQSNYVLTNREGNPCTKHVQDGKFYDELVLEQESQVVPIYIFTFDRKQLAEASQKFSREIVDPSLVEGKEIDDRKGEDKRRDEKKRDDKKREDKKGEDKKGEDDKRDEKESSSEKEKGDEEIELNEPIAAEEDSSVASDSSS
jgi:hypothetical protein